ncbi:sensor histidine kinase [Sphingobacterium hungaricum]
MLKKYKIIILIIFLTAGGIVFILSIWLHSSYKNKEELFISNFERDLFNVIQEFYHSQQDVKNDTAENRLRLNRGDYRLLSIVSSRYPNVNKDTIAKTLDSLYKLRDLQRDSIRKAEGNQDKDVNELAQILSPFMLRKIDFNDSTLSVLSESMKDALDSRGVDVPFTIALVKIEREKYKNYQTDLRAVGQYSTRPILINPDDNEFLIAKFDNPQSFIIMSMAWQYLYVAILIFMLIATFFYLLNTINRQNKLATMRKAFVNNMTHELKTPISTVMAAVESIQRYGAKDDKERLDKYLKISKIELEHLSLMIERVLNFDTAETNGIQLVKSNFDIVKTVESCIESSKVGLLKQVDFEVHSTLDNPIIYADESHIKSVLRNLLDNAIKYSNSPVHITINLDQEKDNVILKIKDNGIGIPKEHLSDVFDMFFRVPSGHLHNVKGFGLGLSYVKQVVEQHGGSVSINSEVDKYSVFVISIPNKKI